VIVNFGKDFLDSIRIDSEYREHNGQKGIIKSQHSSGDFNILFADGKEVDTLIDEMKPATINYQKIKELSKCEKKTLK